MVEAELFDPSPRCKAVASSNTPRTLNERAFAEHGPASLSAPEPHRVFHQTLPGEPVGSVRRACGRMRDRSRVSRVPGRGPERRYRVRRRSGRARAIDRKSVPETKHWGFLSPYARFALAVACMDSE